MVKMSKTPPMMPKKMPVKLTAATAAKIRIKANGK